jgi:hypothetical protein
MHLIRGPKGSPPWFVLGITSKGIATVRGCVLWPQSYKRAQGFAFKLEQKPTKKCVPLSSYKLLVRRTSSQVLGQRPHRFRLAASPIAVPGPGQRPTDRRLPPSGWRPFGGVSRAPDALAGPSDGIPLSRLPRIVQGRGLPNCFSSSSSSLSSRPIPLPIRPLPCPRGGSAGAVVVIVAVTGGPDGMAQSSEDGGLQLNSWRNVRTSFETLSRFSLNKSLCNAVQREGSNGHS